MHDSVCFIARLGDLNYVLSMEFSVKIAFISFGNDLSQFLSGNVLLRGVPLTPPPQHSILAKLIHILVYKEKKIVYMYIITEKIHYW